MDQLLQVVDPVTERRKVAALPVHGRHHAGLVLDHGQRLCHRVDLPHKPSLTTVWAVDGVGKDLEALRQSGARAQALFELVGGDHGAV